MENEVIIRSENYDDFYYRSLKHKVLYKENELSLLEIEENEFRSSVTKPFIWCESTSEKYYTPQSAKEKKFRRDNKIYFSRVIRYRLMGYLLENNPHTLMDYLLCTKCFERINNYEACVICKTEFTHKHPFFLNCNYFYNHKDYKQLQIKHNLQVIQEYYRDERMSMFYEDIEEEIIKSALHPDRIDKIHLLTNCSIDDIDKYI